MRFYRARRIERRASLRDVLGARRMVTAARRDRERREEDGHAEYAPQHPSGRDPA